MLKIRHIAGAVHIGDALHRLPCRQAAGNGRGLPLAHAKADDICAGVLCDAGQHGIQPVIVMSKPPQRCFQSAQDHRQIRVRLLCQAGIDRGAAVRPGTGLAAGGILILRPGDLGHRIVADHTVHVASADKEAIFRLAKPLEVLAVGIAGLGQHAHPVALGLQQAADDRGPKAGVVYIGVAAHHYKIQLIPSAGFHISPADREKFGVGGIGLCRVIHSAGPLCALWVYKSFAVVTAHPVRSTAFPATAGG